MPEGLLWDVLQDVLRDVLRGQSSGASTEMYQRGGGTFPEMYQRGVDVLEMYQLMYQKGCTHPLGTFYNGGGIKSAMGRFFWCIPQLLNPSERRGMRETVFIPSQATRGENRLRSILALRGDIE